MPCDQIRTTTVELAAANLDHLGLALEGLGYLVERMGDALRLSRGSFSGFYRSGQLQLPPGADVNEVKRAYSREVVKAAGKRMGWKVQEAGPTRLVATRKKY